MERRDFKTAWDQNQRKIVNAAELSGPDRIGLDVRHHVIIAASTEEVSVLKRGLQALRAQAELQAALDDTAPRTEDFEQLERVLATESCSQPLQMPDMPEGFFVTSIK